MPIYGADVDQLDLLGKEMRRQAQVLRDLVTSISSALRSTTWNGPDAERFRNEWSGGLVRLTAAAASALAEAGTQASAQAQEQLRASAQDNLGLAGIGSALSSLGMRSPSGTVESNPVRSGSSNDSGVASQRYGSFFSSYNAKAVDYDGVYGAQCVDLVNRYAADLFGVSAYSTLGAVEKASQIFASASDEYFEKVPAGTVPQPGDVVCVGSNQYSPVYGHVAIVNEVKPDGSFSVFQENGATGAPAYVGKLSSPELNAVQGFLRPRSSKISG